jgi:AcrR family transcriptional regulator
MPRAGLDREAVLEAAVLLSDKEGLEGVTISRLAEVLGVRGPSLYNHVHGLEELRRELALRGLRELTTRITRAAVGLSREEAIHAIAAAYRQFAREHAGLYVASLQVPQVEDGELLRAGEAVVEVVLAVLATYGLRGNDALHAVRGLRAVVHGFVSLEARGGFGLSLDLDESFTRLVDAFIMGLEQAHPSSARRLASRGGIQKRR